MRLQPDPRLAELPGFSRAQLDGLARGVEQRRQRLERDIHDYIQRKQAALRSHEQELVEQYRSMECQAPSASRSAGSIVVGHDEQPAPDEPSEPPSPPGDKAKRPKHTRVHKREKELYGLVTPVFLPLLDARETSPTKRKERKSRKEAGDMDVAAQGPPPRDLQADAVKKLKRSVVKKSSLRHKDTPRSRRKRVSLVIDGQTVLPADTVEEPALTSPASEATSASNSTASLDDMIDPRLTTPDPSVHLSQSHAVHHSLPLTMSRYTHAHAPAKPLSQPTPTPLIIEATCPPAELPSPRSPHMTFAGPAPQSITRTFLDPSPVHTASVPDTDMASVDPTSDLQPQDPVNDEDPDEPQWHTYVGGLHGSGVDGVDQAGSYGYPSSLGASYLESYMQNRPLSVRMVAAEKAGLSEREKRGMIEEEKRRRRRREEEDDAEEEEEEEEEQFGREIPARAAGQDDDMEIVGSMEEF